MIEITHLTKKFTRQKSWRALLPFTQKDWLTAVNNVSLTIERGELFGLLGANGAGKTTLVKMLCTLIVPTSGQARIAGLDVVADSRAVKTRIGLVDNQERSFFWRLSGRHNLQFFATLNGVPAGESEARVEELLTLVGLQAHADRQFMYYSSGMRQKLSIARGLLSRPQVLFMDEPTRSLDPVSAQEIRRFVRQVLVNEYGCTVLLVTHNLEEAESLCDRVAIMRQGRIISSGPVAALKTQFSGRQRYQLNISGLSEARLAGLGNLPGVSRFQVSPQAESLAVELDLLNETEHLPQVISAVVGLGGQIQHCQAQKLSLEDVFMGLVGQRGDDETEKAGENA